LYAYTQPTNKIYVHINITDYPDKYPKSTRNSNKYLRVTFIENSISQNFNDV